METGEKMSPCDQQSNEMVILSLYQYLMSFFGEISAVFSGW
jgi:hypothetical protein